VFVGVFAALQIGWQSVQGSALERFVIHDATLVPAAFAASHLTPSIGAHAEGSRLMAPGGGLNILNGCEGMDALFLLLAAFLAAPLSWRSRLSGIALGIVVVFLVNQSRILVLFYAFRIDRHWFDPLHAFVTPIAVVLVICAYFYVCLARAAKRPAPSP